jgi:hypothetical protein
MKELREEILAILADGPQPRAAIMRRSELATDSKQVSNTLYQLKAKGVIGRDAEGNYHLAQGGGSAPPAAAPEAPAPASAKSATRPKAEKPKAERPKPARPDGGRLLTLLERNASDTRTALERCIEGLGDPVLEQLLASAGSAAEALASYRGRAEA